MSKPARHLVDDWTKNTIAAVPRSMDIAQTICKDRSEYGEDWPEWCGMPMAATHVILTLGGDSKNPIGGYGYKMLSDLTASLLWIKSKTVYRFDATLLEELLAQPMDDKLPIEALMQLPYFCVYIENRIPTGSDTAIGVFAWMEWDVKNKMPELRLLYMYDDLQVVSVPVILSGGSIDDSIHAVVDSGIERGGLNRIPFVDNTLKKAIHYALDAGMNSSGIRYPSRSEIAGTVNLILYLCSEDADKPSTEEADRKRSKDSWGNPKRFVSWDVGVRIGKAIRRYRASAAAADPEEPEATDELISEDEGKSRRHNSPRPHIRRAHWHSFWYGKKGENREIKVKWLPPIPVNSDIESESPTVVHLVK